MRKEITVCDSCGAECPTTSSFKTYRDVLTVCSRGQLLGWTFDFCMDCSLNFIDSLPKLGDKNCLTKSSSVFLRRRDKGNNLE